MIWWRCILYYIILYLWYCQSASTLSGCPSVRKGPIAWISINFKPFAKSLSSQVLAAGCHLLLWSLTMESPMLMMWFIKASRSRLLLTFGFFRTVEDHQNPRRQPSQEKRNRKSRSGRMSFPSPYIIWVVFAFAIWVKLACVPCFAVSKNQTWDMTSELFQVVHQLLRGMRLALSKISSLYRWTYPAKERSFKDWAVRPSASSQSTTPCLSEKAHPLTLTWISTDPLGAPQTAPKNTCNHQPKEPHLKLKYVRLSDSVMGKEEHNLWVKPHG